MMKAGSSRLVVIGAVIGLMAGAAARADTPKAATTCPSGPVSIYFSTGDVTASPQAQAVLGKVWETAGECAADRFDIIAHVDAAEGDHALALALERLKLVANQLVAMGLPAAQIRLATDAPDSDRRADVGRRQIDIEFWKREDAHAREDANVSHPRVITLSQSNVI